MPIVTLELPSSRPTTPTTPTAARTKPAAPPPRLATTPQRRAARALARVARRRSHARARTRVLVTDYGQFAANGDVCVRAWLSAADATAQGRDGGSPLRRVVAWLFEGTDFVPRDGDGCAGSPKRGHEVVVLERGDAAGTRYAFAVVGERNSGTTWVRFCARTRACRRCGPRATGCVGSTASWAAELDAYFGAASGRRGGSAAAAALVVVVVKSPLAWVASMCDSPYHTDAAALAADSPASAPPSRRRATRRVVAAPWRSHHSVAHFPGAGAPNISEVFASAIALRTAKPQPRRVAARARGDVCDGAGGGAYAVAVVDYERALQRAPGSSPRSRALRDGGVAPTGQGTSGAHAVARKYRRRRPSVRAVLLAHPRVGLSRRVTSGSQGIEYYIERRYLERFSSALGCAVVGELDLDLERGLGYDLPRGWDCPKL